MSRPLNIALRRTIAAQALQVVQDRGVHRTTMSDIAKSLEMKRPTLYWYFPNLNAIFEVVLKELMAEALTEVTQSMAQHSHPIDQLAALLQRIVAFYADKNARLEAILQLWTAREKEDASYETLQSLLKPQRQFLVGLVDQGIKRGQIIPCDAGILVDALLGWIDGANFHRVVHGRDMGPAASFMVTHLLDPLRVHHEEGTSCKH
jgi:AcrR family transcriptional regulator